MLSNKFFYSYYQAIDFRSTFEVKKVRNNYQLWKWNSKEGAVLLYCFKIHTLNYTGIFTSVIYSEDVWFNYPLIIYSYCIPLSEIRRKIVWLLIYFRIHTMIKNKRWKQCDFYRVKLIQQIMLKCQINAFE